MRARLFLPFVLAAACGVFARPPTMRVYRFEGLEGRWELSDGEASVLLVSGEREATLLFAGRTFDLSALETFHGTISPARVELIGDTMKLHLDARRIRVERGSDAWEHPLAGLAADRRVVVESGGLRVE